MLRQSTDQVFAAGQRHAWYFRPVSRVSPALLVGAGVVMFALYIFADVVASLAYDGYSYKDQAISELSAIDAPTRTFWLVFSVFYQVLAFAFAFGVVAVAGERRKVRVIGWLLLVAAVGGLLWWFGRCTSAKCSPPAAAPGRTRCTSLREGSARFCSSR